MTIFEHKNPFREFKWTEVELGTHANKPRVSHTFLLEVFILLVLAILESLLDPKFTKCSIDLSVSYEVTSFNT